MATPPPPTVGSITPASGSTAGGTPVTIKGSGFVSPVTVTIGLEASEVVVVSEEEITAKTAAGSAGPEEVVVSDVNGTSTLGPTYTYIAPPPPTVTLSQPMSRSNNTMPSFSGTASNSTPITVHIYAGTTAAGPVISTATATGTGGGWTSGKASPALSSGQFTATATQEGSLGSPAGTSNAVTFTVDVAPPQVTLTSPANGDSTSGTSQAASGSAGTAEGDQSAITIQVFAGSIATGQALEAVTVQASSGGWSATLGGLSPGTYTAQVEQRDDVGNIGHSVPATFTITAPPVFVPSAQSPAGPTTPTQSAPASPPVASFQWFPSAPHVGESVSLVSTSTDAASPITGFAWALTGTGPFNVGAGSSVLRTSFSTPGGHVVRLHVTDATGLSSVVVETIPVTSSAPSLLQPFPVVRIVGSEKAAGIEIRLLTVQAPVGTRVTVTCHGPGCPTKSEDLVAASKRSKSTAGTVLIAFRRFERSLWSGAILEIRVSKHGQVGKYTRFVVRHGKLPERLDTCLSPAGNKPIVCPPS
jgi:hypothetical protein